MPRPQRKRLTPKQKKLVAAVMKDPNQSLSQLGQSSGYSDAAHTHRALKAPAVVDALAEIRERMDARPKLRIEAMLDHLEDGLAATRPVSVKVEGEDYEVSAEVKDHVTRHKWWTSAMELRGLGKKPEEGAGGPINIALILAGGGSEAEKAAAADTFLAIRISRGLHPIENRPMTPEEAAQYRRAP